jgi:hypothetical protein
VRAGLPSDEVSVLLAGNRHEDDTFKAAARAARTLHLSLTPVHIDEPSESYSRSWNATRFEHMTMVRNRLLREVRRRRPHYYWSVDSDVLVAADPLSSSLDALERFDAVGGRCYMTPTGTHCPSNGFLRSEVHLERLDVDVLIEADVIMAVKLMNRRAYSIDYRAHPLGEDVGWSIAARSCRCVLGWDGRTVSKHVMTEPALTATDTRCGF